MAQRYCDDTLGHDFGKGGRALALERARSGITVNATGAGWTEGMGVLALDVPAAPDDTRARDALGRLALNMPAAAL